MAKVSPFSPKCIHYWLNWINFNHSVCANSVPVGVVIGTGAIQKIIDPQRYRLSRFRSNGIVDWPVAAIPAPGERSEHFLFSIPTIAAPSAWPPVNSKARKVSFADYTRPQHLMSRLTLSSRGGGGGSVCGNVRLAPLNSVAAGSVYSPQLCRAGRDIDLFVSDIQSSVWEITTWTKRVEREKIIDETPPPSEAVFWLPSPVEWHVDDSLRTDVTNRPSNYKEGIFSLSSWCHLVDPGVFFPPLSLPRRRFPCCTALTSLLLQQNSVWQF